MGRPFRRFLGRLLPNQALPKKLRVQNLAACMTIELDKFIETNEERLTRAQIEIPRWTAPEFERAVLDSNPKVAVFDCDGTLWSGDSGYGFMVWSLEQGLVSRSTSDWIDTRYRAYVAGKVSELQICGEMVQIYAGLREQELREAAAIYVREFVSARVFAEMAALVATLRQAGVELWAVSSTNKWVVAEGVRGFGITENRVLAAEVRVDQGLISSEVLDVPTDAGKADALKRVGLVRPDAVFGNSIHDLAMLELARCAFPVNPSPALLEAAQKNGWGSFRPREAEGVHAAVAGE
jgi:phosphoserine phosphatase